MLALRKFLKHPQLTNGGAGVWDVTARKFVATTKPALQHEVAELVKQAHVFVLDDPGTRQLGAMSGHLPVSPPFPVCWFELMQRDGDVSVFLIQDPDVVSNAPAPGKQWASGLLGALVQETSPTTVNVYCFDLIAETQDLGRIPIGDRVELKREATSVTIFRDVNVYADTTEPECPVILHILNRWLRLLNESVVAVEDTEDEVVMLPRGDGHKHKRKPHQIRRIVRIMPKNMRYSPSVKPITPKGIITGSHRWEVRGHWRRVKTLGKDRAGDYVVAGFTWVKECEKGPSDRPLITKTRVLA
jgi:hypothetical protein